MGGISMVCPEYASWNKGNGYAVWDHPTAECTGIFRHQYSIKASSRYLVGLCWVFYYTNWSETRFGCRRTPMSIKNVKTIADQYKCFQNLPLIKMVWDFCFTGEGSRYLGRHAWSTSIKVQTKTLAAVIDENNIDPAEYDFLNIDAGGSELDILKEYERYLNHVNIFVKLRMMTPFEWRKSDKILQVVVWRGLNSKNSHNLRFSNEATQFS